MKQQEFSSEVTSNAFRFKIESQRVVKFPSNTFVGYFKFENGFIVELTLVEGRPEFENIQTITPNHDDIMKAKCFACQQQMKLDELFSTKTVLYGRAKYKFYDTEEFAISLYIKDDSSPTGVIKANVSCSDKQARLKGIFALSPTEDLRTAH